MSSSTLVRGFRSVAVFGMPTLRAMVERLTAVVPVDATPAPEAVVTNVSDGPMAAENSSMIAYGLHAMRVPVLCVHTAEHESPAFLQTLAHPLLTVARYSSETDLQEHVDRFLTFPATPGRVFTIEGGDGTGKQTQTEMLLARMSREGYPVKTFDFPHDAALGGYELRQVLAGHRGPLNAVHPMLMAGLYATNRFAVSHILRYWVARGYNIVLDRYMEANWGYQACKFDSEDERAKAVDALCTFEVTWLGLPASHRVVLLQLSVEAAKAAMAGRAQLDLHEKDDAYARRVREAFDWVAKRTPGWNIVQCADPTTHRRLSREEVHETLYQLLSPEFVNRSVPTA